MINRDRPFITLTVARVRAIFRTAQDRWVREAKAAGKASLETVNKADKSKSLAIIPKNALGLTENETVELLEALAQMARDGVQEGIMALASAGIKTDIFDEASQMAQDWAREYGAAMLSNIEETTRDGVASLIEEAMEGGWSNDELAQSLQDAYTFSEDRAEMIARTETAYADVAGNMTSYQEAGVEMKEWMLGSDSCEDCQLNASVGPIPFDDYFPDGSFAPPAHPNCTCDIMPILLDKQSDTSDTEDSDDE